MAFPSKAVWKVKTPTKVAFFVWIASLKNILVADNLSGENTKKISWVMADNGEITNPLLLHCPIASLPLSRRHLSLCCLMLDW